MPPRVLTFLVVAVATITWQPPHLIGTCVDAAAAQVHRNYGKPPPILPKMPYHPGMPGKPVEEGRGVPAMHQEPAISTRIRMNQFCLGPAPFPKKTDFQDFDLVGSAHINMGLITVTGAIPSQKGGIWSRRPLTSQALASNWQVDLRFQVGGSPNKEFFGDGFGFWVTEERGVLGDALGGPDSWTGLAVFFDVFKNAHNFPFRTHPYVYAKASNGHDEIHYKNVVDDPVNTPGCHLPFRDPNRMATTVARITLLNGILSVIMRPQGSVDWVQCLKLENIKIPLGGYIGVTAMTGGLVDMHNFISISTFGNVDVQPYTYAHENRLNLMPDMWDQMRESGKVAREFLDWEEHDSFVDDLNWKVSDKVKSHLTDDYDDAYVEDPDDVDYAGDNGEDPYTNYVDDEPYPEEDEDVPGGKDDKKRTIQPDKVIPNSEDARLIKDLEKVLKNNPIGKRIQKSHFQNAQRMERIHEKLRKEMQMATDTLHRAAREIRQKEHELSERILVVGERIKVGLVNPFEAEATAAGRSWFWPFVFVLMILAWMTAYGYSKYRKYVKSHLL